MDVSIENYLIRPKSSTLLIKVSYAEVIINISALNRLLLAGSDWRFHRRGFGESSFGLLVEPSERCPALVFLARFVLKVIF